MSYNFVSSEVNLALVPRDTWWIDTGATTHISVTMQACHSIRLPIDGERYIYTGNGKKAQVQAIGTFQLMLDYGFILILENTFIVPSFRRNLIFVSFWTNLVIFVHLEMKHLVFSKILKLLELVV